MSSSNAKNKYQIKYEKRRDIEIKRYPREQPVLNRVLREKFIHKKTRKKYI